MMNSPFPIVITLSCISEGLESPAEQIKLQAIKEVLSSGGATSLHTWRILAKDRYGLVNGCVHHHPSNHPDFNYYTL